MASSRSVQNKDAQIGALAHDPEGIAQRVEQADHRRHIETGVEQVIDVFDEPPSPAGFGGGTKIVLRKPIAEEPRRAARGTGKASLSRNSGKAPTLS